MSEQQPAGRAHASPEAPAGDCRHACAHGLHCVRLPIAWCDDYMSFSSLTGCTTAHWHALVLPPTLVALPDIGLQAQAASAKPASKANYLMQPAEGATRPAKSAVAACQPGWLHLPLPCHHLSEAPPWHPPRWAPSPTNPFRAAHPSQLSAVPLPSHSPEPRVQ